MDMRFDGVNYFAADARLHYGSVSIKDGYIDRVDMADAAPHGGAKLLLPGCIDTHTHAMLQSEYFAEDEAASAAARRRLHRAAQRRSFSPPWRWMKQALPFAAAPRQGP